jgi:hypothetical protein
MICVGVRYHKRDRGFLSYLFVAKAPNLKNHCTFVMGGFDNITPEFLRACKIK